MRGISTIRILALAVGVILLSASAAQAGNPRCFLHGIITPENGEKKSVSDMIRLHFDANDKAKCELMMTNYCKFNVYEKDYSPTRLKGSFKADVDKTEENVYRFDRKCKLLTDQDE